MYIILLLLLSICHVYHFTIITVNFTVMKFRLGKNVDYMLMQNCQKNKTHVTPFNLYRLAIIIVMFNLFIKI